MWREFYKTRFSVCDGALVIAFSNGNGGVSYTYPRGEGAEAVAEKMINELGSIEFCLLTESQKDKLSQKYPNSVPGSDRDWCDYIYRAKDIVSFHGRAYSGQRNHVNKFKKLYPNSRFDELTAENAADAKDFCDRFYAQNPPNSAALRAERGAIYEMLCELDLYGQKGGVLYVDERVVGLSVGEVVGDTLIVHVEKADRAFDGVYAVLVNAFAKRFASEEVEFINREEDCGEPGLRTSKLSYHPCRLLEKWTLTV